MVVQVVGERDCPLVPVVPFARLVTAKQQDRLATLLEANNTRSAPPLAALSSFID
jgi:hypothetical protein